MVSVSSVAAPDREKRHSGNSVSLSIYLSHKRYKVRRFNSPPRATDRIFCFGRVGFSVRLLEYEHGIPGL